MSPDYHSQLKSYVFVLTLLRQKCKNNYSQVLFSVMSSKSSSTFRCHVMILFFIWCSEWLAQYWWAHHFLPRENWLKRLILTRICLSVLHCVVSIKWTYESIYNQLRNISFFPNMNVIFRLANFKNILHCCNPDLVILLKRAEYLIGLYNVTKNTCGILTWLLA